MNLLAHTILVSVSDIFSIRHYAVAFNQINQRNAIDQLKKEKKKNKERDLSHTPSRQLPAKSLYNKTTTGSKFIPSWHIYTRYK